MQVGEGQFPTSDDLIHSPQCSFHHTTSHTENIRCASREAHRIIKALLRQAVEVDAHGLDHITQLASGQDCINVGYTIIAQFGSGTLRLLSGTGHDGNNIHVLWLLA